ncbi:MAG TPA: LysR family transcriptional regulator [Acetobacteraceae bacterium]|nr:LysR family transcriptional regulator [Acetobacteraceae bacterium]
MMDPTLRQLGTFLATVECGSVSAAALRLNLTQPAASQQLRQLERALGVRLLERAGGRMRPTAAGAAIIAPAGRAQAAAADTVAAAAAHRSGEVGQVRLGTGATACIHLLPPVLATLRRRMPKLAVTIATGNTPEILRRLEAGELDIALVTLAAGSRRSLTAVPLVSDPLLAVIPAAMVSASHRLGPLQMERLPLVLYEPGSNTRAMVDAWFRRAGVVPRPLMELGSVEAIKVVVAGGLGASVLPQLALADPVPGTVTRPLHPALTRKLGYVLRREKVVDRGLRAVIEALEALRGR